MRGEAREINTVVHALVNDLVERIDLTAELGRIKIVIVRREVSEFAVEHSQQIVVGITDDAFRLLVPQDGNGDASSIIGIGRAIGFAQELEAVYRIFRK